MVTATEFYTLKDAANRYLTEDDYGVPEDRGCLRTLIFDHNHAVIYNLDICITYYSCH